MADTSPARSDSATKTSPPAERTAVDRAEAAEAGTTALALLDSMAGDLASLHGRLLTLAAWSAEHSLPGEAGRLRWIASQVGNVADDDTVYLVIDAQHRAERGL